MALPPLVRQLIDRRIPRYCRERVPGHLRDQVRTEYSVWRNSVTIFEVRPHWREEGVETRGTVAQFRYDAVAGKWILYWRDRNGRWREYTPLEPTPSLEDILAEIDRDPTGIFWG